MSLDIQTLDLASLIVENIDMRDYPDFSDALVTSGFYKDGIELTEKDLDSLNENHHDLVEKLAYEKEL